MLQDTKRVVAMRDIVASPILRGQSFHSLRSKIPSAYRAPYYACAVNFSAHGWDFPIERRGAAVVSRESWASNYK